MGGDDCLVRCLLEACCCVYVALRTKSTEIEWLGRALEVEGKFWFTTQKNCWEIKKLIVLEIVVY